MRREDVPVLPGWVSIGDAANRMYLTRNGMLKRVFERGQFKKVCKIFLGDTYVFLLDETEVDEAVKLEMKDLDALEQRMPMIEERKRRREQRARILAWVAETGWGGGNYMPAHKGRLPDQLTKAYADATGEEII